MITSEILKEVLLDQIISKIPAPIVQREIFQRIEEVKKNPFIIIIMGLRRSGKSTLLQMIREHATEKDFYINFDDDRLAVFELSDFQLLLECWIELFGEQKTVYLDEIQNIPEWERFVRRLHDSGYKIFITGSNATMLSKELGTRLTGRYLPIEMYPFSFREFVNYFQSTLIKSNFSTIDKAKIKGLFADYLKIGGLPEYIHYPIPTYLHTLYENILYRDIISRYQISNVHAIKLLGYFLASNNAKETNYSKLAGLIQVSPSTVSDYCQYLENCYLNFMINRYSPSLKKQYGYQKKSFFIDIALAQAIGFRMSEDRGRALEEIVFLELKRTYKEIYFHKENKECDFLIKEGHKITLAIQVTSHLKQEAIKKREISGLLEAMQLYHLDKGLILTEDEELSWDESFEGKKYFIQVLPLWKWLLR